MTPPESHIEYAPPGLENRSSGRSVGTWIKLALVWAVGLLVWAVYLGALTYAAIRIL